MKSDLILSLQLIFIIIIAAVITEFLGKHTRITKEYLRKVLHIIAMSVTAVSPFLFENRTYLISLISFFVILTFIAVKIDLFKTIHEKNRKSWGIFLFPLAFLLQLLILPAEFNWVICLSFLVLAFADSAAAIFGIKSTRGVFRITSDKKSITGSMSFFAVSVIVILVSNTEIASALITGFGLPVNLNVYFIFSAIVISLILMTFEAASSFGSDNFIVPTISAILFYIFLREVNYPLLVNFIVGMTLAGIVALISFKLRFLTFNGSVATFLLAGFIFGFGGWKWSLPILTFFILSSILSKIRKRTGKDVETHFEKSGVRDYLQVAANGGIGGALVIVNIIIPNEVFYYIYLASLAAVCADTWGTEIGTLKKANTYNILNFQQVSQGVSGGISILGTLGGLAGAIVISLSGYTWNILDPALFFLLIVFSGFFGSIVDSILGATVQLQNRCIACGKITERKTHCDEPADYFRGFRWINNDFVNLMAGITGSLIIVLVNGLIL